MQVTSTEIPHTIHYCWFGGKPLPDDAQKCIASWRKFFPGWEIVEWNESNYDVRKIAYTAQAYEAGKYAFVSDYARFDVLYEHGGVYFDTDVEVIKPFDDILAEGAFMGCESDGRAAQDSCEPSASKACTNPGLGIAAAPGLRLYEEILDFYKTQQFVMADGTFNQETVVSKVTSILVRNGLKDVAGIQKICDITIYPSEYFNPLDSLTGKLDITENTHSIHWYTMSWFSGFSRNKARIGRIARRIFGRDFLHWKR